MGKNDWRAQLWAAKAKEQGYSNEYINSILGKEQETDTITESPTAVQDNTAITKIKPKEGYEQPTRVRVRHKISQTPIKDKVVNLWNTLIDTSGQTMLANPSGYPMYTGAQKFNTTVGDELKVAGAGAASIGLPAAAYYAYSYPISVATDLGYGYAGTELGGAVGKTLGKPIDALTGNHYVSEGLGYLGNIVGGGLGINAANNFRKRGIELIMRSSDDIRQPNLTNMYNSFKNMPFKRKSDIAKYILTGHKAGPKGYYNSLISPIRDGEYNYYSGLDFGTVEGNDIIDAYLYGKTLDKSIGTPLPKDTPTPYVDYIARNYSDKDIPIYMTTNKKGVWSGDVPKTYNWGPSDKVLYDGEYSPFFKRQQIDVGGHLIQRGQTDMGIPIYRGADLWKFNPEDYIKRWNIPNDYYLRVGLNEVNKAGTPILSMTPWIFNKKNGGKLIKGINK